MSKISFNFNKTKAIESILYLSSNVSNPEIYNICKLLYLADKISLETYGRFIFGDTHVAMEDGATPSNAYNLLKPEAGIPELRIDEYKVIPQRSANIDYLSESDIESLDQVIKKYGRVVDWRKVYDATHDVAWQMAWDNRGSKDSETMSVESIAEQLSDSEDLIDYLSNVG